VAAAVVGWLTLEAVGLLFPFLHVIPERERPHVSPHFFDVSQAFRLGPALPTVVPANRVISLNRPNRVLPFMIHKDLVVCIVFTVVHIH
jgi:hypothetical protein